MKRLISLCILLCLLLSLTACAGKDIVAFYYTRQPLKYEYGTFNAVIVPEARMAQGHTDDLTYLLNLYLEGPLDTELLSPMPEGTELIGHSQTEDVLNITLYGQFEQMKPMDFTVASACVARTCFDLTDAQQVTIWYTAMLMGTKTVTISRDSMVLMDDMGPTSPTEPTA